jgi:hypothetical protein
MTNYVSTLGEKHPDAAPKVKEQLSAGKLHNLEQLQLAGRKAIAEPLNPDDLPPDMMVFGRQFATENFPSDAQKAETNRAVPPTISTSTPRWQTISVGRRQH